MDNADKVNQGVGLVNQYKAVIKQSGMLYFSCQRGGQATCDHCGYGQKIKVSVSVDRPPTSPPPPPLPCNEVVNCDCSCCDAAFCPGWPASESVYVHFSFNAKSPESCNTETCSTEFGRRAS